MQVEVNGHRVVWPPDVTPPDVRPARTASTVATTFAIVGAVAAISFCFLWIRLFQGFVLDDAFIAFRYSENLTRAGQLTWNPGENPIEGFTSFAWVIIGAALQWVSGLRPHVTMPYVGLACWIALIAIVLPRLVDKVIVSADEVLTPGDAPFPAPWAALIGIAALLTIAANPYVAFHAFHGLETPLHILVFATAVYFALRVPAGGNRWALAAVSFVAMTVRPDAVVFLLPLWTLLYLFSSGQERRGCVTGFVVFCLVTGIYTAVKWAYYGYPLPNTFYVKQGSGFQGLSYVKEYLDGFAPIALLTAWTIGRIGMRALLSDKTAMLLLVPAGAFCLAHTKIHPVVGYGYRFVIMTAPLLMLFAVRVCVLMATKDVRPGRLSTSAWREAAALLLVVMLAQGAFSAYRMRNYYPTLEVDFRALTVTPVLSGKRLQPASVLTPPPLLASSDVGALPYFSHLGTLDLFGLNDEHIAHDGLTHEYIASRNADLLVLQDLYLTEETRRNHAGIYSPVTVDIDGKRWFVDMVEYDQAGITDTPERRHNSAAKTFQVVTTPGFSSSYRYVTNWALGDMDRYYVFVRLAYPKLNDLIAILGTDDLDPEGRGHPNPLANRARFRQKDEPRTGRWVPTQLVATLGNDVTPFEVSGPLAPVKVP